MKEYRLVIAGGTDFTDYALLKKSIDLMLDEKKKTFEVIIVCGIAEGAEMLGERYAAEKGYEVVEFPAPARESHFVSYRRQQRMAEFADAGICFWDGQSKQIKQMIDISSAFNLDLIIIKPAALQK